MHSLTELELTAIRRRHAEAAPSADHRVADHAAHEDRDRLLAMVDELLPVAEAARLVTTLIQRGGLPPVARRALLELHLALAGVAEAGIAPAFEIADGLEIDEEGYVEPVRLSA